MLVLGIESSCDETAAAVVEGPRLVRSNVIATQHELHERYAGVVPEIASRAHIERILPVVMDALRDAGVTLDELDAIAVGNRPGLVGSLLVGVSAAKALAWSLGIPCVGVDHVAAHLIAGELSPAHPAGRPALGLVVSGGHTSIFTVDENNHCVMIGRTIDDAIGEAFDKAAVILDLGYPGGPLVDAAARRGNDRAHDLPISMLSPESLDFSYSGLKTALRYAVSGPPVGRGANARFTKSIADYDAEATDDFAASFERAAVTAIIRKLGRALERFPARSTLLVGGGVSANTRLRAELAVFADERGLDLRLPQPAYCVDNAAMIAAAGADRIGRGERDSLTLTASPQSTLNYAGSS